MANRFNTDVHNGYPQERTYSAVPQRLWDQALNDPVKQFLSRSGKGIRPELVNELFRLSGGTGDAPRAISEAIELLHAGSLLVEVPFGELVGQSGKPTEGFTPMRGPGLLPECPRFSPIFQGICFQDPDLREPAAIG
jgi:hypothetical protein